MDYLEFAKDTISRETLKKHQEINTVHWEDGCALQQTDALICVLIDIAESLRAIKATRTDPVLKQTDVDTFLEAVNQSITDAVGFTRGLREAADE